MAILLIGTVTLSLACPERVEGSKGLSLDAEHAGDVERTEKRHSAEEIRIKTV